MSAPGGHISVKGPEPGPGSSPTAAQGDSAKVQDDKEERLKYTVTFSLENLLSAFRDVDI